MAYYLMAVKSGFGGLCGIEGQSVLTVSVLVAASQGELVRDRPCSELQES